MLRGEFGESMVLPGEEEEDYMAATATARRGERSKILHNFTFPELKWGNQKNLRCMKVDDGGSAAAGYQRSRRRSSPYKDATPLRFRFRNRRLETESPEKNEGIGEVREKIMSDLRTVAESMFRKQVSGDEDGEDEEEEEKQRGGRKSPEREVSPPEAPGEAVEIRPWNLRKRRAACKAPISGLAIEEKRSAAAAAVAAMDPPAPAIRSRLLSTLSKKEIEEDYMKMMSHRPPRRPKKRSRTVQKQVDMLKPALYFSEVTEDIY